MTVYRGDTTRWHFILWADEAKTIPFDLTDATVLAQLRDNPDGDVCATLNCTINSPNIVAAELTTEASAKVVNGSWDLQVRYMSGDIITVLAGPVVITADVSR